jgi:hypothetical protein
MSSVSTSPTQERRRWPELDSLVRTYRTKPIVVFAGAGATLAAPDPAQGTRFGVGTWTELLDAIVDRAGDAVLRRRYEQQKRTSPADPWFLADWIHDQLDGPLVSTLSEVGMFERLVIDAVRGRNDDGTYRNLPPSRGGAIRQLPMPFLHAAPTMNAIVALCGELRAVTGSRHPRPRPYLGFRVEPNRHIQALVTPNFDPYLEAAASRKYKRSLLKPVGSVGSAGSLRQIPVFHIHGYVPFRSEPEYSLTRSLVLTSAEYRIQEDHTSALAPALGPQVHLLRHYASLFIGFSFHDPWIEQNLRSLHEQSGTYGYTATRRLPRFAIVDGGEFDETRRSWLKTELGVHPIPVDDFAEIPEVLGVLYAAGADRRGRPILLADETSEPPESIEDRRARRRTFTPAQVWEILCDMTNGRMRPASAIASAAWEPSRGAAQETSTRT